MNLCASPELGSVVSLLEQAGLPSSDLNDSMLERFIGASSHGALVGVVGFEAHGTTGLLRSLVVTSAAQGSGLGATLVAAIESQASAHGIKHLYLLTTDAADYFSRHGYQAVDRAATPESIKNTTQFSSLCPGSATVLKKEL